MLKPKLLRSRYGVEPEYVDEVADPFTVIDCTQFVVMTLSQATHPLPPIKMALPIVVVLPDVTVTPETLVESRSEDLVEYVTDTRYVPTVTPVTVKEPLLFVVAVPVVPSPVLVAVTVAPDIAVPSKYVTVPDMFPVAAKAGCGNANQASPIIATIINPKYGFMGIAI